MNRRIRADRVVQVAVPWDAKLMLALANALLAGLLVFVMMAAVWWALRHPSFGLQHITVEGDVAHNNEVTLRANVAPKLSGNFFTIDLERARAAFELVPWVRKAVVQREFPNGLRVTLQEHQAVAMWGNEADARLVNVQGEVFDANVADADVDNMPRLMGPDSQSAEVLGLFRLLAPLFAQIKYELSALELTGRGSWRAHLDSGSVVELGRGSPTEIQARVLRLTQTLTQVASRYGRQVNALVMADLRYDNGYALQLRGVSTLEPAVKR